MAKPVEKLEKVILDQGHPEKVANFGSQLLKTKKIKLRRFLNEHVDVFTWMHDGMLDIDPKIISHQLMINPTSKPVKQKRGVFN